MGVGEAVNDTKKVTSAASDLALIAGQKPVITRARKAISTFKVRENMPIGAKVTLRKTRMYEFLDRLVTVALPRVRDFRGLDPKSFDGRGNYALGVKEHIIFPEIDYDKAEAMLGPRHRGLHDGQDRQRGAGAAARLQLPVPAVSLMRSNAENWRPLMAKKSAIENNQRKQRMVKKFAAPPQAPARSRQRRQAADGGALRGAPQARRAAAQRRDDPRAQSLRSDRPSARLLSQDARCAASRCANSATRA